MFFLRKTCFFTFFLLSTFLVGSVFADCYRYPLEGKGYEWARRQNQEELKKKSKDDPETDFNYLMLLWIKKYKEEFSILQPLSSFEIRWMSKLAYQGDIVIVQMKRQSLEKF